MGSVRAIRPMWLKTAQDDDVQGNAVEHEIMLSKQMKIMLPSSDVGERGQRRTRHFTPPPTCPQPKTSLTDILFTMSLLTRQGRITVKAFASVPALANLPEIQQEPCSVSDISSVQSTGGGIIDLNEGCIVTKSVKYTHQLIHWVNAVRDEDPNEIVSRTLIQYRGLFTAIAKCYPFQEFLIEYDLRIIPYKDFSLSDACNLTYRKSKDYPQPE